MEFSYSGKEMRRVSAFLKGLKVPAELVGSRSIEIFAFTSFAITGLAVASLVSSFGFIDGVYIIPAWVLLTAAIYILNDVVDVNTDKTNGLDRPLVNGNVSKNQAIIVALGFVSLSLIIIATINAICLFISLVYLALGVVYSIPPIKLEERTLGKPLTYGSAFILCQLAGSAALGFFPPVLFYAILLFSPFMFLTSSITDLKDVKGDKKTGCITVPVLLGPRKTIDLAIIGLLAMTALIIPGYAYFGFNLAFVVVMVAISAMNLRNLIASRNLFHKLEFMKLRRASGISLPIFQLSIIIGLL